MCAYPSGIQITLISLCPNKVSHVVIGQSFAIAWPSKLSLCHLMPTLQEADLMFVSFVYSALCWGSYDCSVQTFWR